MPNVEIAEKGRIKEQVFCEQPLWNTKDGNTFVLVIFTTSVTIVTVIAANTTNYKHVFRLLESHKQSSNEVFDMILLSSVDGFCKMLIVLWDFLTVFGNTTFDF